MENSFHTVEYGEGFCQSQQLSFFIGQDTLLQINVRLCFAVGINSFRMGLWLKQQQKRKNAQHLVRVTGSSRRWK